MIIYKSQTIFRTVLKSNYIYNGIEILFIGNEVNKKNKM